MLLKSVLLCNKDCHFDEIGNDVNTKGELSRISFVSAYPTRPNLCLRTPKKKKGEGCTRSLLSVSARQQYKKRTKIKH